MSGVVDTNLLLYAVNRDAREHEQAQILGELPHPSGNLFFDIRTVALMREHGVRRIYTADTDFLKFAGIEAVDPTRTG